MRQVKILVCNCDGNYEFSDVVNSISDWEEIEEADYIEMRNNTWQLEEYYSKKGIIDYSDKLIILSKDVITVESAKESLKEILANMKTKAA